MVNKMSKIFLNVNPDDLAQSITNVRAVLNFNNWLYNQIAQLYAAIIDHPRLTIVAPEIGLYAPFNNGQYSYWPPVFNHGEGYVQFSFTPIKNDNQLWITVRVPLEIFNQPTRTWKQFFADNATVNDKPIATWEV